MSNMTKKMTNINTEKRQCLEADIRSLTNELQVLLHELYELGRPPSTHRKSKGTSSVFNDVVEALLHGRAIKRKQSTEEFRLPRALTFDEKFVCDDWEVVE